MNSDYVKLSFVLATRTVLPQGSYIVHKNITYRLYEPYTPDRNDEVEYRYEPVFHSKVMGWIYKPFFFLQTSGGSVIKRESDWTLTGTITDFLNRIIASILDETGESYSYNYDLSLIGSKTIQFQAASIIEGLNEIADAWETEWWIDGSNVRIGRCSHGTAVALTVGTNVGVPTITRNREGYYTRFYAFGSTRNISQDYTAGSSVNHVVQRRLNLPLSTCPNGYKDIRAGLTPIEINSKVLIFDDIYPRSSLSISSVRYESRYRYDSDGNRIQTGTDPGGDPVYETYRIYYFKIGNFTFDEDSIIEGKTLAIHFESGNLAGWDFDLAYHGLQDEFEIIIDEGTGYVLPNELLAPAVDDLVVLYNILMPQSYTAAAEEELEDALDREIEKLTSDVDSYEVNSYPVAFQASGISLTIGRNVTFTNGSVVSETRVIGITEKLDEPNTVRIKLGEKVTKRVTKKLQEEIVDINKAVEIIASRLINVNRARRNWNTSGELLDMVFDQDGYFDGTKIKPESIETMMLRVGSRSQQLSISCVITPNYGGNPNSVNVSSGALAHYGMADTVQNWNISSSTTPLTSSGAYYIYAKCSKVDAAGAVIFSQSQIMVDEDEGFYHFLLGMLHSVDSGVRWISLTNGATVINGRYIRTGVITSQDGLNFFDLDGNKFKIGDNNSSLDWNDTTAGTLTLKGALVQSSSGISSPLPCFRGTYNETYIYYKGDMVTYDKSTWQYINDTATYGQTPAAGIYWTVFAAGGEDGVDGSDGATGPVGPTGPQGPQGPQGLPGTDGADGTDGTSGNFTEFRFAKNGSTTTPPSLSATSLNPSGWSTTPPSTGALEYLWFTKAVKNFDGTALVSNWTTPVRLKGEVGATGATGPQGPTGATGPTGPPGPASVYQGNYSSSKTYYGNSRRVDVVRYNSQYYVARVDAPGGSFSNVVPTNTSYWNSFGANFESVATSLLFAELAYVENLGVRHFRGIPTTTGNLSGSFTTVQTHLNGTARVDRIVLSGSYGECSIWCNYSGAVSCPFTNNLTETASNFVSNNYDLFYRVGVVLTSSGSYIYFTAKTPGVNFSQGAGVSNMSGNLTGAVSTQTQNAPFRARIDRVTLSGTGGHAEITVDNVVGIAEFNGSLAQTAMDFVNAYSAAYNFAGISLSYSSNTITFTETDGRNFEGPSTIANDPYGGAIKIYGNEIWEDVVNNDLGELRINMRGYEGNKAYFRRLLIGDGKGQRLAEFLGRVAGSIIRLNAPIIQMNGKYMTIYDLPSSGAGLYPGSIYRMGNYLMVKT
jgi:hypothetical protein